MKRFISGVMMAVVMLLFCSCRPRVVEANIIATTLPVYTFTRTLCEGTPITVNQLVQENISCLHDYSLSVKHMQMLESADYIIISGGGLEDFLTDAIPEGKTIIDASFGIGQHHAEEAHGSTDTHHHESDPHFWLSIKCARQMAHTIYTELQKAYPQYTQKFSENMDKLDAAFTHLEKHAETQLSSLHCRKIITFHNGFSYMAESLDLTILHAVEEESGSEASAQDLIEICELVTNNALPAIFTEKNGSSSAAALISNETGAKVYNLDMAISGNSYFDAMYHNIDTLKEALG